ncbi:PREDICTED: xin actin-binding repeat-containing protein 1 isoform X2 [Poecilia mexicana]|uniref:xin actin-binding repeat-containing protein 1 isoform X2 n=1 Tax=Poecilia mexicana TaxID=48701 RepID=UPI00072E7FEB|nr:PREDICTED: xin actin-binding repeat-containing protein 1 isoform X2 [Poecilia mexicana]
MDFGHQKLLCLVRDAPKGTNQTEGQRYASGCLVFFFLIFLSSAVGRDAAMETFSLRRTQSLKSLSGTQQRSWVASSTANWNRKSVSQLVQHYQSCADLRSPEKADQVFEESVPCVDSRWKRLDSRDSGSFWTNLSRSRSMDFLPQKETSGTRALRALFESKASLQQDYHSSLVLNSPSTSVAKAAGDCPLQDWRSYNTSPKENTIQRTTQVDGRKAPNGLPESYRHTSRHTHDDKYNPSLSRGGTSTGQSRDRISTSSSVKDRLALYLSRTAAIDSVGGSEQPELRGTPRTKAKTSKMADAERKITVSQPFHEEDDLPPPPPPPVPPRPFDYEGPMTLSSLPLPPPKETFSTFYQQRQKSELKRLYKHIHPNLRASLDDAVDDEIMQAVQAENTQALDAAYQGEVQSMRWIFENWTLDNIGDPHETKKLLDTEELKGGDVRSTSTMFEHIDGTQHMATKRQMSVRGDVRTSTWLFETQPLDALSKSKAGEGELVEALLKEPIQSGDVRGTRLLFESRPLSDLGRCNSIEDRSVLKLKSELQEQRGNVRKTLKLFETEPCCAIRDNSGNIHEIKSICREEINSGKLNTARWLFETQPLDTINKGSDGVKIIRGISLEEGHREGVDQKRWMFETQSFDTITEVSGVDTFRGLDVGNSGEANVVNKKKLFEMQPRAAPGENSLEKEPIIGGDVKSSMWLFETQPMQALSDSCEAGRLKKISLSAEEQGEVKGKKLMFENVSFQKNTLFKEQEIEKGDVKGFKQLFETIPLSQIAQLEQQVAERQETNKAVTETSPLYAIKDSSGNLHEVTTVSREEFIKGKVKNYKWMFETKPLDQLADGKDVEIIKGITRQEDTTGDVKTAKWLFETQTIDGIHCKFNKTEQSSSAEQEPCKGDVKTCKWLFETQPMDMLYDKMEKTKDKDAVDTDVKSMTWLFESQPLDTIRDGELNSLKLCSTKRDSVKPEVAVQTVKHLFETETLDRIRKESDAEQNLRCISQVNFQSGDVSRVKELFESQSLDEIGSEIMSTAEGQKQGEHVEKGSVHKATWMFENCPMNQINRDQDEHGVSTEAVGVLETGDVQNKRFIFETSSLDKIQKEPIEEKSVSVEDLMGNVDVKSSTMMFESLPLYAIRDKEGQFHEVTTVKKEEVMSGDVRGARWMFETKPLDAIKAENEVYVIRAVTQEDVKKGDVKSARWKFETQPLDSLTERDEPPVLVTEDFGGSSVQLNKQIFESEQSNKKFVRMVSVTDVQRGDVRTSTWLFENQTLDSLKGEPQEQSPVKTVHREDSQKGDVKRCTWMFESQPLDKIKESEDASAQATEEIPKADVKCTTWLFETTPLDKITANSVADTLSYLYEIKFVHSSGIIIEENERRHVNMAKYLLESSRGVQIQKEDIVAGNIRNIMLQLLLKPTIKPQVTLLREVEKGQINTTVVELPVFESTATANIERDRRIQNIAQMIDDLLVQDKDFKKGIIMQESGEERGEMSVFSLMCNSEIKTESHVMERGDVKTTIGNLLATANNQRAATLCRVDENEKGNVNLYKSCIEKGDLDYLKSLHTEESEFEATCGLLMKEQVETVQGGVQEAKRSLCQQKEQVERTVCDVLPGDVKNTKKVFSSEPFVSVDCCIPREEIIPGDVSSAKQQLAAKQPVIVDKEEVVPGDIKATMESLERAKQQSMSVEREMIKPGTIYEMDLSAHGPVDEGSQPQKEVIVSGDVRAAKKSLEMAKQQSMQVEREVIVPGKIYNLGVSVQEESSSTVAQSTCSSSSRCQQIKTCPQVSDAERDQESHIAFENCQPSAVVVSNCAQQTMPLFIGCDFNGQTTEDEIEEVIRGDVKAAIRSLQSAATEQRLVDKENVVRGNVQLALESLEKSSVNVSKGDYKAAMIYRNSGRTCLGKSKTVHNQCVVVPIPSSDTTLSPSISVTCEGQPRNPTQFSPHNQLANGPSILPSLERVTSPPLIDKSKKPKNQKPALPPKPQWITVEAANTSPTSPPKVTCQIDDNVSAVVSPKQNLEFPIQSIDTPSEERNDVRLQRDGDETQGSHLSNKDQPMDSNIQMDNKKLQTPLTERKSNVHLTMSNSDKMQVERNVIQKINTAEEIQMCMKNYAEDGKQEMNMSLRAALKNFEKKDKDDLDKRILPSKKVKVSYNNNSDHSQTGNNLPQHYEHELSFPRHQCKTEVETSQTNSIGEINHSQQNDLPQNKQELWDKVVLREKKVRETEEERRQRLSVHKDEIMKENAETAMEIFDNLRKREELKGILSQVQEIEGEPCSVDATSLKSLYSNVPPWMVVPRNPKKCKKEEKKVAELQDDDLESISSVESAFEDLEKASKEIMKLKEQTLAKLVDIEETIKKALYSVSNLKSEADIAGLSGLFDESLKSEQNFQPVNSIKKISIVSSKTKPSPRKESPEETQNANSKPLIRQSFSQSSPSFISIRSARKPSEQQKPTMSTFKPDTKSAPGGCHDAKQDLDSSVQESPSNGPSQERKVSVLEVKAVPEQNTGIIGTKTVSETYEESNSFGNVFVSSVTSTFVTNQPDSKTSALFEVVGGPARYEVTTSPLMQRSGRPFQDKVLSNARQNGTVFVTFSQPKQKK